MRLSVFPSLTVKPRGGEEYGSSFIY